MAKRIPAVTVSDEENNLITKLKHVIETKTNERISLADLVRLSIRELAKANDVAA